jgi:hypothetical protein
LDSREQADDRPILDPNKFFDVEYMLKYRDLFISFSDQRRTTALIENRAVTDVLAVFCIPNKNKDGTRNPRLEAMKWFSDDVLMKDQFHQSPELLHAFHNWILGCGEYAHMHEQRRRRVPKTNIAAKLKAVRCAHPPPGKMGPTLQGYFRELRKVARDSERSLADTQLIRIALGTKPKGDESTTKVKYGMRPEEFRREVVDEIHNDFEKESRRKLLSSWHTMVEYVLGLAEEYDAVDRRRRRRADAPRRGGEEESETDGTDEVTSSDEDASEIDETVEVNSAPSGGASDTTKQVPGAPEAEKIAEVPESGRPPGSGKKQGHRGRRPEAHPVTSKPAETESSGSSDEEGGE